MTDLKGAIEAAWDRRDTLAPGDDAVALAVEAALAGLDSGELRVAERGADGQWTINQWLKKAVLLSFRLTPNSLADGSGAPAFDKVPLKTSG
ncbi:MAG: 2,3,4,5-tetrahydropyridine-2,6-dicarboxylate N-succinyltransferase, partial [Sandaracinobacteroides sp.]